MFFSSSSVRKFRLSFFMWCLFTALGIILWKNRQDFYLGGLGGVMSMTLGFIFALIVFVEIKQGALAARRVLKIVNSYDQVELVETVYKAHLREVAQEILALAIKDVNHKRAVELRILLSKMVNDGQRAKILPEHQTLDEFFTAA